MWETLGKLGEEQQAQIAWLINQKALQLYIERGAPFEYTLKGIEDAREITTEHQVIELIWQGKSETEIVTALSDPTIKSLRVRWRELVELYQAGHHKTFDDITNTYILVKP